MVPGNLIKTYDANIIITLPWSVRYIQPARFPPFSRRQQTTLMEPLTIRYSYPCRHFLLLTWPCDRWPRHYRAYTINLAVLADAILRRVVPTGRVLTETLIFSTFLTFTLVSGMLRHFRSFQDDWAHPLFAICTNIPTISCANAANILKTLLLEQQTTFRNQDQTTNSAASLRSQHFPLCRYNTNSLFSVSKNGFL